MKQNLHESPGNPEQQSSSVGAMVWGTIKNIGSKFGRALLTMTEEPIPYELEDLLTPEMVRGIMEIYYKDRRGTTPVNLARYVKENSIAGLGTGHDAILAILAMHFNIEERELSEKESRALRIFFAKKIGLMHGA